MQRKRKALSSTSSSSSSSSPPIIEFEKIDASSSSSSSTTTTTKQYTKTFNDTRIGDFYDELFSSDDDDDDIDPQGLGFSNKVKRSIRFGPPPLPASSNSQKVPPAMDNTRNPQSSVRAKYDSDIRSSNIEIHSLLDEGKWDEAFHVISTYPHLAKCQKEGSLPLHIALTRDAPLNLIQAIIGAHPDACQERRQHHHKKERNFPLTMAIRTWNRNDDGPVSPLTHRRERELLIETMFNEAPHIGSGSYLDDPKSMKTVLHLLLEIQPSLHLTQFLVNAVEALPGKGKKIPLCRLADAEKCLPLHRAIENHCDDAVIEYLIRKYPEAMMKGRDDKFRPLHIALLGGCTARVLDLLLDNKDGYKALLSQDCNRNNPLHLWFITAQETLFQNFHRMAKDDPQNYNIISDEEVFEKIVAKFSLTKVRELLLTVNENKDNMIDAATKIQELIEYPKPLLDRMKTIMNSDQYEVGTDDEKYTYFED